MKFFAFVLGFSALALSTPSMALDGLRYGADCVVTNPSAHQKDVGYIYRVEVRQTGKLKSNNTAPANISVYKSAFLGSEELQAPVKFSGIARFEALKDGSTGLSGFSGSWDNQDTWIQTTFDARKQKFVGDFTFEQDFLFQVQCKLSVKVLG